MTTWLDFRTEPIVAEVPEVTVELAHNGEYIRVTCMDINCTFWEKAETFIEGEGLAEDHQKWHEDGMPE